MDSPPELLPLGHQSAPQAKDEGVELSPERATKKPVEAGVSSKSQAHPATTADATPDDSTTSETHSNVYSKPPQFWRRCNLPEFLLKNLERVGISGPAAVQAELLKTLGTKRFNILVASESPADKRFAVCLSALCFAQDERKKRMLKRSWSPAKGPAVVLLCPTREHAFQTFNVLKALAHRSPLNTAWAYGGTPMEPQIRQLRKHCDVLVATPGRLIEIVGRYTIAEVGLVVVNESQTLLSHTFHGQMEELWRQDIVDDNTLWAFTCNRTTAALQARITSYLRDNNLVIKHPHPAHNNPLAISVSESIVPHEPRKIRAFEIVQHIITTLARPHARALILANSVAEVEMLYPKLRCVAGLVVLLGTYSARERDMFLRASGRGATRAILTTDAFAEGLEFDGVRYVVQTYLPRSVAALERSEEEDEVARVQSGGRAPARFGRYAWTLLYRQEDASGQLPRWPIVSCSKVLAMAPKRQWGGR
ncbi:P-loop containing nucleoside triphosphate hydrolase protein [Phyllosticta citribraziliensis]|uniref:RNA helicase n=1 Tax=Phyllosticta citribraziliensis TaxID=989973 RepID=A0ABR1LMA5_9PEZI